MINLKKVSKFYRDSIRKRQIVYEIPYFKKGAYFQGSGIKMIIIQYNLYETFKNKHFGGLFLIILKVLLGTYILRLYPLFTKV